MRSAEQLRDLLAPLGVYRWEGSFQWGELKSGGAALDDVEAELARLRQEMNPITAQDEGLRLLSSLLSREYEDKSAEEVRDCLMALLRINGRCLTLAAVNDALKGCGVPVRLEEGAEPMQLSVYFPDSSGPPKNWDLIQGLLEDILPCHVGITYRFRSVTWESLEAMYPSWAALEAAVHSWAELG